MKKLSTFFLGLFIIICFSNCENKKTTNEETSNYEAVTSNKNNFNGYESQIKWGEHLVTVGDCGACHTPKKMTDHGPVQDIELMLSGHPKDMPRIEIDRKEIESKGLAVTRGETEWIGPWGVSFAANLTPDDTGIGNWTEEQFIYCLREGKFKGLAGSRMLLPPMPWESFGQMTDGELKAMFAYLKSIKPINNLVPPPEPPLSAGK